MMRTKRWKRAIIALAFSLVMALSVPSVLPLATDITTVEAAVRLNKSSATILVGNSVKLKVKGISSKKKVKWKSSNTKVATVSKDGKVMGIKSGKVKISAKVGKKTYQCSVRVRNNQFTQSAPSLKSLESGYIHFYPMKVYYKDGDLHYEARIYNRKPFRISSISDIRIAITVPDGSDEGLLLAEKVNEKITFADYLNKDSSGTAVKLNPGQYVTYDFVFHGDEVLVKDFDLTTIKKVYYVAQYDFSYE